MSKGNVTTQVGAERQRHRGTKSKKTNNRCHLWSSAWAQPSRRAVRCIIWQRFFAFCYNIITARQISLVPLNLWTWVVTK